MKLETVRQLNNLRIKKALLKGSALTRARVLFLLVIFTLSFEVSLFAATDLEAPFIALDGALPQRTLNGEESFAILYLDTAAQILKSQSHGQAVYQRALEVIGRGLDLAPQIADLNYASAWLNEKMSKHDRALFYYQKAIEPQAQWLKAHWSDAVYKWSEQLFRRGKIDAFVLWLTNPDNKNRIMQYSSLLTQASKAYFLLGQKIEANRLLNYGLSRYPDNLALMALKFRFAPPSHLAAGALYNRFSDLKDENNKDALFWLIHSMQASQERLSLTSQYLKNYGPNNWVVLAAIESSLEDEELQAEYLSFFNAPGVELDLDVLERLLSIIPLGQARDTFLKSLLSGKRIFFRDRDFNSYFEEELFFENGLPVFWTKDIDQNGVIDSRVSFINGRPSTISGEIEGKNYLVRYHNYPELASLSLADLNSQEDCYFVFGNVEMRILDLPVNMLEEFENIASIFSYTDKVPFPIYSVLKDHAYLSNLFTWSPDRKSYGLLQTRYEVLQKALVSREDSNGDSVFDRLTWYDNGSKAFIIVDPQDDGSFPLLEYYAGDVLQRRVYFSIKDSLAYSYNRNSALIEFDVNRNKILETAELQNANRLILRQFSSLIPKKMLSFEQ